MNKIVKIKEQLIFIINEGTRESIDKFEQSLRAKSPTLEFVVLSGDFETIGFDNVIGER